MKDKLLSYNMVFPAAYDEMVLCQKHGINHILHLRGTAYWKFAKVTIAPLSVRKCTS